MASRLGVSALSLVANPQQVLVHSSICVRTANPCISNGEEVIFVLTGAAGYPRREAFVNFGRIMYDTNLRRGSANDSFHDRPCGRRQACWATMCFIGSLAASRLAFFSHDGGQHACYGWWKVASVAEETEESKLFAYST